MTGLQELPAPVGVRAAVVPTAAGYDLEAAIPLAVLADNHELRFPAAVGLSLLVTDPDGGEVHQLQWVGRGDDQATWGRLTFAG
ncbi:MAG: hypothetical protein FJ125_07100 [Deltaproteobacteria bacterium]|nr:hypothetical protein [Deltaproteobacteria bacterium]